MNFAFLDSQNNISNFDLWSVKCVCGGGGDIISVTIVLKMFTKIITHIYMRQM